MKWSNDKIDGLRPRTMEYVNSQLDKISFGNSINKHLHMFLFRTKSKLKKLVQYFKMNKP